MIEADSSKVICPKCCHQFTAIFVNDQDERSRALSEIESLRAERDAAVADAARGKWMIANATWSRHGNGVVNNVTEMIIRVADGADLSCKAMREAAIDAAIKGEAP